MSGPNECRRCCQNIGHMRANIHVFEQHLDVPPHIKYNTCEDQAKNAMPSIQHAASLMATARLSTHGATCTCCRGLLQSVEFTTQNRAPRHTYESRQHADVAQLRVMIMLPSSRSFRHRGLVPSCGLFNKDDFARTLLFNALEFSHRTKWKLICESSCVRWC